MATWGQVASYIQYLLRCWHSSPSDESSLIRSTKNRSRPRSFSRESASTIICNYLRRCTWRCRRASSTSEVTDVNTVWRTTVVWCGTSPGVRVRWTPRSILHITPSPLSGLKLHWGLQVVRGRRWTTYQQRREANVWVAKCSQYLLTPSQVVKHWSNMYSKQCIYIYIY